MPVTIPPIEALAQFLAPTTRHTRRIEIYEADGVTRWTKDTTGRLKDGSVSVDYTRDERRGLDLTLDNSDQVLVHAPGEFWYDKVIKVFRGVQVNSKKRLPKVLIVSDSTTDPHADAFREAMASLGYGDVQTNILASNYDLDVAPYDIVVGLGGAEDESGLLASALRAGKSVFVFRESSQRLYDGLFGAGGWTKESVTTPGTQISPRNVGDLRTLGWRSFVPDSYDTAYNAPTAITAAGDTSVFGIGWAGGISAVTVSGVTETFDAFDDTKWWMDSNGSYVSGQLQLVPNQAYGGLYDLTNRDLTNSAVSIEVVQATAQGNGSLDTSFTVGQGSNNISFTVEGGLLYMRYEINGTWTNVAIPAYDSVAHRWWKISEYDGRIRWSTSPDGAAWTERASIPTTDFTPGITALKMGVNAGYWGTETDMTPAIFDNLNIKADGTTPMYSSGTDGATSFAISSFYSSTYGKAMAVHFPLRSTQYMQTDFYNFMRSAMTWLNPVVPLKLWEVQIGEFMIDRISEAHFPHDVKITGRDYTKKCMLSKFTQATMFQAGQTLEGLIGTIAANAGITKRLLPNTGVVIGDTFTFDRNTSRWDAMKQIATAYNYEIYFDATGYLTIRPFRDPTTSAPVVWIETGKKGQIASYTKSTSDASLFNHILVTGESSDQTTLPVYAEAINTNPDSPTNIDEIGDRYWEYSSSLITDQQQAQDLADSYLSIQSLEEFELDFETLLMPWLEVGDILGFIDPNPAPGDPSTFLLSSLTLPLTLAPMSGVGKRVLIVGM